MKLVAPPGALLNPHEVVISDLRKLQSPESSSGEDLEAQYTLTLTLDNEETSSALFTRIGGPKPLFYRVALIVYRLWLRNPLFTDDRSSGIPKCSQVNSAAS